MYKRKVVQLLSKYIRGLTPDQVSSHLLSGEFELRDAELEVSTLNTLLAGHLPFTLQVHAAVCDSVHVQVPWSALSKRPVRVRVGGCRAEVEVHSRTDPQWIKQVAEQLREVTVETAASRTVREGNSCPNVKLNDMMVAVADGLEISVAFLEVTLLSAVPAHHHGPCSLAPTPAWKLVVADIVFGPTHADGSRAEGRPGIARGKGKQWTALHRRLTLSSVAIQPIFVADPTADASKVQGNGSVSQPEQLGAQSPTSEAPQESAAEVWSSRGKMAMSIDELTVDMLEWRDAGLLEEADESRAASTKKTRRVTRFPREVRAKVNMPSVQVHCNEGQLAALTALACDVAVPTVPPLEALPPELRHLHWRDPSIADAIAGRAKAREAASAATPARTRMGALFKIGRTPPRSSKASSAGSSPFDMDSPPQHRDSPPQLLDSPDMNDEFQPPSRTPNKMSDRASDMAQRGAAAAASSALKTASAANNVAQKTASVAGTVAQQGAKTASTAATAAATSAKTGANKAAASAAAAATVAKDKAAAGARMAERTAAAAAAVAGGRTNVMTSATKSAAAARQAASDKAKGAASSLFRGSKMFGGARSLVSSQSKSKAPENIEDEHGDDIEDVADVEQQVVAMGFDADTVARVQMQTGTTSVDDLVSAVCVELNATARQDSNAADVSGNSCLEASPSDFRTKEAGTRRTEDAEVEVETQKGGLITEDQGTTLGEDLDADHGVETTAADNVNDELDRSFEADEDDEEEFEEDGDEDVEQDDDDIEPAYKSMTSDSAASTAHARSAAQTLWAGPPPFLRRAAVHLAIGSIRIEVAVQPVAKPTCADDAPSRKNQRRRQQLILEAETLDVTIEELRCLADAEVKSLEKLLSMKPPLGLFGGGHGCATLGSARARVLDTSIDSVASESDSVGRLFWTEAAAVGGGGGSAPWMFTARWGRTMPPPSLNANKSAGSVRACVCLHGARAVAEPVAISVVESLVAAIAAALPPPDDRPSFEPPPCPVLEVNLMCRDTALDVGACAPLQPLRAIIPAVCIAALTTAQAGGAVSSKSSTVDGNAMWGDVYRIPSVPPWHSSVASAVGDRVESDFNLYGCLCDRSADVTTSKVAHQSSGIRDDIGAPQKSCSSRVSCENIAEHLQHRVTERQWRAVDGAEHSALEVLMPTDEFLTLSGAKLQAVEHAAEWEAMAQSWHLRSTQAVADDTARRVPMVRELLKDGGGLDASLQALHMGARELEDERQDDQLRLRTCEREVGNAVATIHSSHAVRERELCQQLSDERETTAALERFVEQQEAAIRELQQKWGLASA